MNYLLDTNIISELVAKQPNQKVVEWVDSRDPDALYLSVVTIGELRKGIEKLKPFSRRDALMNWLTTNVLTRFQGHIADITVDVMLAWGELTGRLEVAGLPMSAADSLIAAIALEGGFTLVTRNDSDFQNAGISIVNPWR
jgi:tRNA(fMet)-specific endonuclease VapC